ncbi:hypothetical protein RI129_007554 [Pyrocoelia pectoralis]|uniref:Uncharacterized protein n=1 Tax=Pyrocoelia pectoralis TaxID=417401 RepID=A0AAN7VGP5_9COLE
MNTTDNIIELIESDDSEEDIASKEMDSLVQNENTKNISKKSEFVEDEDVPSDFFDDFLNNDFMDGLDVVDIWDDECEKKDGKTSVPQRKSTSRSSRRESSHSKRRRTRSTSRRRYREEYKRRGRSRERYSRERRSRERRRGYTGPKAENKDAKHVTETDESLVDHRRDPEKTKRDIQKDKDKCAKNQEEKFISEKLKVVETGLVPPGTELDIDLNVFKSSVGTKIDPKSKASRNEKRKSTTPHKHGDKKNVSSRPHVPKRSYRYSRSPYYRKSRSPARYSRSPVSKRRRSSERRLFSERSTKYRDYPTERYRRRSRSLSIEFSPESPSDRSRDKRPLKTSWSNRSNSRSRGMDFLEELANKLAKTEKKKYYKKVQQIITQPLKHPPTYQPILSVPVPAPVPAPMPIPIPTPGPTQYFPQHMDTTPQYDHHFFIGQQFPTNPMHYPPASFIDISQNVSNGNIIEAPIVEPMQIESPSSVTVPVHVSNAVNTNIETSNNISIDVQKEKEAIHKLFEDKKISLSDFLSMSAKHADSTEPINVQKKIKVISLCQDVIKILGNELQLSGRFFLTKTQKEIEKPQEGKFMSPLRKIPIVRFSFTTPSKSGEEKTTMQSTLSKLLASLGVVEAIPPVTAKPSPSRVAPEPLQHVTNANDISNRDVTLVDTVNMSTPKKTKMCQTDSSKCQLCEIRKSRKFVNVSSQVEIDSISVGTQVSEDDFIRMGIKLPIKDNLKNQSLSHLTPAQLMRQTLSSDDHSQNSRLSSEISPEKQNYRPNDDFNRPNLSTNDNFARQIFGFDKRSMPEKFAPFGNFPNTNRMPGTSPFENRPRHFEDNDRIFENRNSTPTAPNKGINMGGNDFYEPRNNFPNIPNPTPSNKRSLLPIPYPGRKY